MDCNLLACHYLLVTITLTQIYFNKLLTTEKSILIMTSKLPCEYDISAALGRLSKADSKMINNMATDERLHLQTYGVTMPLRVPDSGTAPGKCDSTAIRILKMFQPTLLDVHVPLQVAGDGNCLFRAVSRALYHTEAHHLILRLLTALEILENRTYYDSHLENYEDLMSDVRIPNEAYTDILCRATTIGAFSYMQHVFALSAVIGETILSYHPNSMNMHYAAFTRRVAGRNVKDQPSQVKLLWSAMSVPQKACAYNANHFVFLYCMAKPAIRTDVIDIDDNEVPSLTSSHIPDFKNYKTKIPISSRPCKRLKSYAADFVPIRMGDLNIDITPPISTLPPSPIPVPSQVNDNLPPHTSLPSPVSVRDTPTLSSEEGNALSACICAEGGFEINSGTFLNIHALYPLLRRLNNKVMPQVPRGLKENQYFLIDNQRNFDRRQAGHISEFVEDCGAWQRGGPSPKAFFLAGKGAKLKNIFDKKKQGLGYCLSKTVNKKVTYVTLETQPEEKDVIYVHRNYSALKADKSYRRRITWLENCCDIPKVAMYEYIGKFPGASQ